MFNNKMSDYSTNGSVPSLIPGDVYVSQATFTSDVQLGTGSYLNTAVTPNVIVPSTVTIGDSLAQIQFFSADGGMGAAYASQQGTTVAAATPVVIGTSGNITSVAGYTYPQVIQALINYGLLAGTSSLGTN